MEKVLKDNTSAKNLAELYIKTDGDRSWFWEELQGKFDDDVYEVARILAEGLNQK